MSETHTRKMKIRGHIETPVEFTFADFERLIRALRHMLEEEGDKYPAFLKKSDELLGPGQKWEYYPAWHPDIVRFHRLRNLPLKVAALTPDDAHGIAELHARYSVLDDQEVEPLWASIAGICRRASELGAMIEMSTANT